jgi:hypothetical protein
VNLTAWQPVFTLDAAASPLMAGWNHVLLAYCDGAYFNGDIADGINVTTPAANHDNHNSNDDNGDDSKNTSSSANKNVTSTLFFAGRHVLDAVLDDLALRHGMSNATDVVLGGCSAGGIATFAHLDYVARRLTTPTPTTQSTTATAASTTTATATAATTQAAPPPLRVVGLADSGFYADVPYYTDQKQFPFQAQNMSAATLSPECLADNAAAPHRCLVAEVNARCVSERASERVRVWAGIAIGSE